MSLKLVLNFALNVEGDGTSLSVSLDLTKIPVALFPPGQQASGFPPQVLSSLFDLNGFPPTAVVGLTPNVNSGGPSQAQISGHILTLTYTSALPSGTIQTVGGTFIF